MSVAQFWIGYAALMGLIVAATVLVSRRLKGHWVRHALVCLALAIFIAPSVVFRGHGIGPALMAVFDAKSAMELLKYGLGPIVISWAVLFGLARVFSRKRSEAPQ